MIYSTPDPQTIGLLTIIWAATIIIGRRVSPTDLFGIVIAFILLYGPGGIGYALGALLAWSFFFILFRFVIGVNNPKEDYDHERE